MYLCTACNEFSAYEYFDRYDGEIYIKCRICGKIQDETQPDKIESEKEMY